MFDLYVSELVKADDDKLIFNAKYRSRPLVRYRRPHGLDNKIFSVASKGDTTPILVVWGTDILTSKECDKIYYHDLYGGRIRDIYTDEEIPKLESMVSHDSQYDNFLPYILKHLMRWELQSGLLTTNAFSTMACFLARTDSRKLSFNLIINDGCIGEGVVQLPLVIGKVVYDVADCIGAVKTVNRSRDGFMLKDVKSYDIGGYDVQFILGVVYGGVDTLHIIVTPKTEPVIKEDNLSKDDCIRIVNNFFHPCFAKELNDDWLDGEDEVDIVDRVTAALLTWSPLSHSHWYTGVGGDVVWFFRGYYKRIGLELDDVATIRAALTRINELCRDDPRNPNPGQDIIDIAKVLKVIQSERGKY